MNTLPLASVTLMGPVEGVLMDRVTRPGCGLSALGSPQVVTMVPWWVLLPALPGSAAGSSGSPGPVSTDGAGKSGSLQSGSGLGVTVGFGSMGSMATSALGAEGSFAGSALSR